MVMTAIFPEITLCDAIAQFRDALSLSRTWRGYWPEGFKERDWLGMPGAFFVAMGGCTISDAGATPAEPTKDDSMSIVVVRTLSPAGLIDLLGRNIIQEQIPYALISSICWWKKPFNVTIPIELPIADVLPADWDRASWEDDTASDRASHKIRVRRFRQRIFSSAIYQSCYDMLWPVNGSYMILASFLGFVNGALHAAAWFSKFPSKPETYLCRWSCVAVVVFSVVCGLLTWRSRIDTAVLRVARRMAAGRRLTLLVYVVWTEWLEMSKSSKEEKGFPWWDSFLGQYVIGLVFVLPLFTYWAGMFAIITQAFISVRNLPAKAYDTVTWANYIPHL
ncbi:hypothetical protein OQA88_7957 [Cercophora sp. LCS_1]